MKYKLHCTTITVILLLQNVINPHKPSTNKSNLISKKNPRHAVSKRNLALFIEGGKILERKILPGWKDWEKDQSNETRADPNSACKQEDRDDGKCQHKCVTRELGWQCTRGGLGQNWNTIEALGKSWVMERNALLGATSNEENCKLQCLARPECEHTTSLNIWSFEGRDPATEPGYKLIERFFDIYPLLNTTNTTERINMTLCTLYRSCSEITEYEYSNTPCDKCKVTYNHCPWVPVKKQSSGADNFTVDKEFHALTLFIWFMLRVISGTVFI